MLFVMTASSSIETNNYKRVKFKTKNFLRSVSETSGTKNGKVKFRSFNPAGRLRRVV